LSILTMLRTAVIGCGIRGSGVYMPVLRKMNRHFRLAAVCDGVPERADAAASRFGAKSFHNVEEMLDKCRPDLAVVAVTPPPSHENAAVALQVLSAGIHLFAETPIAPSLEEADRIIALVESKGLKVEMGENYYRTPRERFNHALLESGVFGPVHVVYSDFVGHGYHGIALLRSYVGFNVAVERVIGLTNEFAVEMHLYRPGEPTRDKETWQFGVLEFHNGAKGVFSFSTLSYGSPLRWGREKCQLRFYAARGMGAGPDLAILEDARITRPIKVRIKSASVEGQSTIAAFLSDLPGSPGWENPLRRYPLVSGDQHSELTIGLQLLSIYNAITNGTEPEYGVLQARRDRQLDLAMSHSWSRNGEPVSGDFEA